MAKTIIFCADGTWNGPGELDTDHKTAPVTNVFKLFLNLAGDDNPDKILLEKEQERRLLDRNQAVLQVAEYIHGVGDSDNTLVRLLGGTTGAGLITRIVRGYTFISRHYRVGDKIIILGFSRGAYTARALAGLISARGLLDATKLDLTDKPAAYRLGAAAWYANRREAASRISEGWLARLEEIALDLPGFLAKPPDSDKMLAAPIEAVAVWETVGSLGIPQYSLQFNRTDVFQFADRALSKNVRYGFHAVAVDEEREDFAPTLWDPDPRIIQALFPGSHADVGGGHPLSGNESGLSDAALLWLTGQLTQIGVRFSPTGSYQAHPDPAGVAHMPWLSDPWRFLPKQRRVLPAGLTLAPTLLARLTHGPVVAQPGAPPANYDPDNLRNYLTDRHATGG